MKVIAIDSSGLVASVAVVEENLLLAEYTTNNKQTHSQTLLPMLDEITKMLSLDLTTIDAIALAAGPGSFTGLRIGAATAKGLGFALNKPLVAVPTVDGLAYNMYGSDKLICPILDARRSQVYTGIYEFKKVEASVVISSNDKFLEVKHSDEKFSEEKSLDIKSAEMKSLDIKSAEMKSSEENSSSKYIGTHEYDLVSLLQQCVVTIEEIAEKLNTLGREVVFLGDGVPVFIEKLPELMKVPYFFAPAHLNRQRAATIGTLGLIMLKQGKTQTAEEHQPEYLRLSQAEREQNAREELRAREELLAKEEKLNL